MKPPFFLPSDWSLYWLFWLEFFSSLWCLFWLLWCATPAAPTPAAAPAPTAAFLPFLDCFWSSFLTDFSSFSWFECLESCLSFLLWWRLDVSAAPATPAAPAIPAPVAAFLSLFVDGFDCVLSDLRFCCWALGPGLFCVDFDLCSGDSDVPFTIAASFPSFILLSCDCFSVLFCCCDLSCCCCNCASS